MVHYFAIKISFLLLFHIYELVDDHKNILSFIILLWLNMLNIKFTILIISAKKSLLLSLSQKSYSINVGDVMGG